jgi:hypothetical protein
MSLLDNQMNKIMKLKNVDDDKNWSLYKLNLIQYDNLRKKKKYSNNQ